MNATPETCGRVMCGCTVRICDNPRHAEHIEYCPVHAAAPELRAALRDYLGDHGARVTGHGLTVLRGTRCDCRLCEAARAALAKADGSA